MRVSVAIAVACLGLVGLSVADESQASIRKQTHIPAQGLGPALQSLAKEREFQIVYVSEEINDRRTQGATGDLTIGEALTRLLNGTGLTYRYLDENTVTVLALSSTSSAGTPSSAFDPATQALSTPQAINNPNTPDSAPAKKAGFWDRFRLAQNDQSSSSKTSDSGKQQENSPQSPGNDAEGRVIDEIVVTGTHIRGAAADSSPVTVYDRKKIEQTGAGTVAEFLRKIPQNFSLINEGTIGNSGNNTQASQNVSYGTGVNLRGLGSGSTLVLLNGHRLAPGGQDGSFVDVSMIPLSAVERIDVLTDGASAIYGADAVAGVVNFILRRDFDGAETSLRYGSATQGDGRERTFSQLLGTSWSGGNAMLVYEGYDSSGLRSGQRDFVPPQGGSVLLLPEQKRSSVVLAARQSLTSATDISMDAYFSNRDFETDVNQQLAFENISHTEGFGRQYGAVLGVGHSLPGDWRADFNGMIARTKEHYFQEGQFAGSSFTGTQGDISSILSADLKVEGPLGHGLRASFGAGGRRETFEDFSDTTGIAGAQLQRNVFSAFAEVFIPLISTERAKRWANRLELVLAGRYDNYQDIGSSADPKVGLLWSPIPGLNFRSTWGTSFRVPTLAQLTDRGQSYQIIRARDPLSPTLRIATLIPAGTSNPDLQPETADSLTIGLDIKPAIVPDLSVALTYFRVDYQDRINRPPLVGVPTLIFFQTAALGPFIEMPADPARVQEIFANYPVSDPFNFGQAGVQAFFDFRLQNIAKSQVSGLELSADYTVDSKVGEFGFFCGGDYLFDRQFQSTSTTPSVDLLNRIYNPMDLKLRGGVSWARGGFSSSMAVNYSRGYSNELVIPTAAVDSWTTADLYLSYSTRDLDVPSLRNFTLALSVQNLTDEDPPFVVNNSGFAEFGYDPTNASALGRTLALQISKRW